VYLVGHTALGPLTREQAAVLACGPGAVLSHRSAAAVWGLLRVIRFVDVTVRGRKRKNRPGLRIHSVSHLEPSQIRRHQGIPLTSPARTLLDLAEVVSRRDLERAYDEAQFRDLVTREEIFDLLARSPGRRGQAPLRSLLDLDAVTRSSAERKLLRLMRNGGLGPTHLNTRIGLYEVDMLWEPQRLIVEVDGYAYHSSRSAFERDRLRDADLQAAGYRVVRVTWRQLVTEPEALVRRLARLLRS
jgi:very-short-patch-repair endonuclease